jgi:multiple sugar transport system substrate-binding protein
MMKSVRIWTALAAATALTLTACGSNGGSADPGSNTGGGGDGEEVTLRFSWWGSDARHGMTQEIIDAFQDENPNITINGEYGDFGGYWDKLATQVASNDAPDIIQMDEKYIREYADRGALLDLSDVDVSEMSEATVATGVTPEGSFGIPTGINALMITANPTLFEEAGVELPDDTTWTWEDYSSIAQDITENSSGYGAAGPNEPATFQIWLRQQGKEMTDENGEMGFEVADAEQYLQMHLDLMKDGAYPAASILSEDQSPGPDQSLVGTGQAAMGGWWSNQLNALSGASGEDLVPLRLPSTDGENANLFYKSSMFMSANGRTEHPEEVKMFIDYMVNSEEAAMIGLADRGLPANLAVREAILPELDEADARGAEFLAEIEDELGPDLPIPPLGFSALQETLYRYELDVFFERSTPAQAAEQMYSEFEGILAN